MLASRSLIFESKQEKPQASSLCERTERSGTTKMPNWFFQENLPKRFKTEKENITNEFYIFKMV